MYFCVFNVFVYGHTHIYSNLIFINSDSCATLTNLPFSPPEFILAFSVSIFIMPFSALFLAVTALLIPISFLHPSISCQKVEKEREEKTNNLFFFK